MIAVLPGASQGALRLLETLPWVFSLCRSGILGTPVESNHHGEGSGTWAHISAPAFWQKGWSHAVHLLGELHVLSSEPFTNLRHACSVLISALVASARLSLPLGAKSDTRWGPKGEVTWFLLGHFLWPPVHGFFFFCSAHGPVPVMQELTVF